VHEHKIQVCERIALWWLLNCSAPKSKSTSFQGNKHLLVAHTRTPLHARTRTCTRAHTHTPCTHNTHTHTHTHTHTSLLQHVHAHTLTQMSRFFRSRMTMSSVISIACRIFSWMVRSFSRQSTLFSRRRRVVGRFTFSLGLGVVWNTIAAMSNASGMISTPLLNFHIIWGVRVRTSQKGGRFTRACFRLQRRVYKGDNCYNAIAIRMLCILLRFERSHAHKNIATLYKAVLTSHSTLLDRN
jgi:hypothetical protein